MDERRMREVRQCSIFPQGIHVRFGSSTDLKGLKPDFRSTRGAAMPVNGSLRQKRTFQPGQLFWMSSISRNAGVVGGKGDFVA
jgi:hypothetical protein